MKACWKKLFTIYVPILLHVHVQGNLIFRLLDLRKVLSVRDAAYTLVDKNHEVDILHVSL